MLQHFTCQSSRSAFPIFQLGALAQMIDSQPKILGIDKNVGPQCMQGCISAYIHDNAVMLYPRVKLINEIDHDHRSDVHQGEQIIFRGN